MLFGGVRTHRHIYFVATLERCRRRHPDESVLKLLQWMWPRRRIHLLQFQENRMLTSRGLRISVTHLDGSIALCARRGNGRAKRCQYFSSRTACTIGTANAPYGTDSGRLNNALSTTTGDIPERALNSLPMIQRYDVLFSNDTFASRLNQALSGQVVVTKVFPSPPRYMRSYL